jgi:hypothetical protein
MITNHFFPASYADSRMRYLRKNVEHNRLDKSGKDLVTGTTSGSHEKCKEK